MELIIGVLVFAFILEFIDAFIGMGFGTLGPVLLLFGYPAHEVVPALLFASMVLSLSAGAFHHLYGNVHFSPGHQPLKLVGVLTSTGLLGVSLGVWIAEHLREEHLQTYIGLMIVITGTLVILQPFRHRFSWKKIVTIGSIAGFNKGMSGGGYGPILASGQVMSGVPSKRAVGVTALSEGLISVTGLVLYVASGEVLHWSLITSLIAGGALGSPLAAYAVSRYPSHQLGRLIGIGSIIIGVLILARLYL